MDLHGPWAPMGPHGAYGPWARGAQGPWGPWAHGAQGPWGPWARGAQGPWGPLSKSLKSNADASIYTWMQNCCKHDSTYVQLCYIWSNEAIIVPTDLTTEHFL